jgi:restriction system protein
MIPEFQLIMLPLLKLSSDQQEHSTKDFLDILGKQFGVTEEEKLAMLASGSQRIWNNRVHWARAYLKMAGLVENTKRGYFRITQRGLDTLKENPEIINIKYLKKFPDFLAIKENKKDISEKQDFEESTVTTPQEQIDSAFQTINNALAQELLQKVNNCSWQFFEKLVIDLLLKMGYGGSKNEAAELIGKTGDEGIDGIIKEDRLGLGVIYVQAKQWKTATTIGRPEIQKFVGALAGQGAKKGVFITTTKFSSDAKSYLPKNETKVILIDGRKLVELMIEFELGISIKEVYKLKIPDDDYFNEE